MKVRLICLLLDLANGEKMPKKIIIHTDRDTIAPFTLHEGEYLNHYTGESLMACLAEFDLNNEVEIIEEEVEPTKPKKVEEIFVCEEDDMGWTYISEGSCKYYIPVEVLNRIGDLAKAVNYLLEKEGE